jgi:hypothetical protein
LPTDFLWFRRSHADDRACKDHSVNAPLAPGSCECSSVGTPPPGAASIFGDRARQPRRRPRLPDDLVGAPCFISHEVPASA